MLTNSYGHKINGAPDFQTVIGNNIFSFYINPNTYTAYIRRLSLISIVISAALITAAYIILYRIKRKVYDPIPNMMNLLNISPEKPFNEYILIENAIKMINKNNAEYNDIIKNTDDIRRRLEFINAVSGERFLSDRFTDIFTRRYCCLTILFEDLNGDKDSPAFHKFTKACGGYKFYPVHSVTKYGVYFFFLENSKQYDEFSFFIKKYINSSKGFVLCAISGQHEGSEDIGAALDESLTAFKGMPTDGLDLTRNFTVYGEYISSPKYSISAEMNNILIKSVMLGDFEGIKNILRDILYFNKNTNLSGKHKLLYYLYDTVCLIFNQVYPNPGVTATEPDYKKIENIYNPRILFDRICENIEFYIQTARINGAAKKTDEILKYINNNLHRDISLSDLADAINMSYVYAGIFFKEKIGMNFIDFLQKNRIELARRLLAESNKNIEEISIEAGFVSINNFYRVFKKIVGVSPGVYRKNLTGVPAEK